MRNESRVALVCAVSLAAGCFSMIRDPARRFYVLHVSSTGTAYVAATEDEAKPRINDTVVRVRDLDCESAYDRFQMVVRKSPFELTYRNKDVWAVKPGHMVSDMFARGLQERRLFSGVTRELGERRPDWLISGDLHAIEIEQMQPEWRAHLAFTLQASNVDTGDIAWSGRFEETEAVPVHDYGAAAEAMSRALNRAMQQAFANLSQQPLSANGGPQAPKRP